MDIIPDFSAIRKTNWYLNQFVIDAQRGHAGMNPQWHKHKYARKSAPLTPDLAYGSLNGQTRPLKNQDGKWGSHVISLAVTPQTLDPKPLGKNITLDVDTGGRLALIKVLEACQRAELKAFAQEGQSATHDGGHIWIMGAELLPAEFLADIGKRIALTAGVACEIWPCNADLRLPLQMHLRAPGGPRRFPLILQTGEIVDTTDPWAAIDVLMQLPLNTPETLTRSLGLLPSLPEGGGGSQPQPIHRSQVNPGKVQSVISWYNSNSTLDSELQAAGATVDSDLICCPFHDDTHPSLSIFTSTTGKKVAHCWSRQSNCPAAEHKTVDAFDVYCLRHNLTPSAAVARLVSDYKLGEKRQFTVEDHTQPATEPTTANEPQPLTTEQHRALVRSARGNLVSALVDGSQRAGTVTTIKATPGLGKTHAGAELAKKLHADGKTVRVFAPTLEVAENEWATRLGDACLIWRSKLELCTCHDSKLLGLCLRLGYSMPQCTDPTCPYAKQQIAAKRDGRIIIFQHNHLTIGEGAGMIGTSLLLVDESPLNALLPLRHVTPGTLAGFAKRHPGDPAALLCAAMAGAAGDLPVGFDDTRGPGLVAAIEKHLGGATLGDALRLAQSSQFNVSAPKPPGDVALMAAQFLAGLLDVMSNHPERLSWGKGDTGHGAYLWHERQTLAKLAHGSMFPPAVVVLDGSADREVCAELYAPWPVEFIEIDCPVSPLVKIVQVNCTASTRAGMREDRIIANMATQIAYICNKAKTPITLDGGISYQRATKILQEKLGGAWLHYGGQRGSNELDRAGAIAVVCSPTTPPSAIERKAIALWGAIPTDWQKTETSGLYSAVDGRLEAMNRLHGFEELRQSVYRARPLTASAPVRLLVFTPWPLDCIGLKPAFTVTGLPHGNSAEMKGQIEAYRARAGTLIPDQDQSIFSAFPIVNKYIENDPTIGNDQNIDDYREQMALEIVGDPPPSKANKKEPVSVASSQPAPMAPFLPDQAAPHLTLDDVTEHDALFPLSDDLKLLFLAARQRADVAFDAGRDAQRTAKGGAL